MENKNFYYNSNKQYFQFLVQILEKISARRSAKEITNFLFNNQDKINLKLGKIVQNCVPSALAQADQNRSYLMARDLTTLAELILKNITQNKAYNI